MTPRVGSLFSGTGAMDLAVCEVLGATVAWHCETEPAANRVLSHHWPGVPNLGDITAVDWTDVEPVDILTAGYPCQPFSHAGQRQGTDDARHLWPFVADALGALRPGLFVGENVRGHLTLGFDQVIRDLEILSYDVRWMVLRAADVGAPHGRSRLFMIGSDRAPQLRGRFDRRRGHDRDSSRQGGGYLRDPHGCGDGDQGVTDPELAAPLLRRAAERDEAGDRSERPEDPMGSGRRRSPRRTAADRTLPHSQTDAGPCVHGVTRRDPHQQEGAGPTPLDRVVAGAGRGGEAPHSRPERARPGAPRSGAATGGPGSGVPVGSVVGTGGGSVRSCRVHRAHPCVRADGGWAHLRAADVGAPHGRFRVFITAWPAADPDGGELQRRGVTAELAGPEGQGVGEGPQRQRDRDAAGDRSAAVADAEGQRRGEGWPEPAGQLRGPDAALGCNAVAVDPPGCGDTGPGVGGGPGRAAEGVHELDGDAPLVAWGDYGPAVRRWELILGRPAPAPTQTGKRGGRQLSPLFVEWLMGLPAGWVTAVPGLSRNEQLKLLGNGVVPQQCAATIRGLLQMGEVAA